MHVSKRVSQQQLEWAALVSMLALSLVLGCQQQETQTLPPYYQQLVDRCQAFVNAGCCMESVERMAAHNAQLMPESGCPEGTQMNTLKCPDSYHWCEPAS